MTGTAEMAATRVRGAQAWLHQLRISDFRNLASVSLAPPPEGLALVGDNGQGKTNFLEAVYYLELLRSVRGARDQELVRFGATGFHLSAAIHGGRANEISVGFERATRRKRVRIDGAEPARLSDGLGALPAVIFSPQDAALVTGAPSERRRFLDVILALTSRRYLSALQTYRSALAHRNAALRDAFQGGRESSVAVWEPALAESGAVLWVARREWVATHAAHFAELCIAIGESGAPRLNYVSALEPPADDRPGAVAPALLDALERKRALDIRRGLTHSGPHRDDLSLTLTDDAGTPRDLRAYGSAGQQRTAAIALRMLEAATLRAAHGVEPIVLLDDPFAELDARRAGRILELLNAEGRGQTLLAVPRPGDIPEGLTRLERWTVERGVLAPAGRT